MALVKKQSKGLAARSSTAGSGDPQVMMDINTTPLIDVMLVLLVMLIITIPIQLHAVNLQLPVGTPPPNLAVPHKVQVDIDENSALYWQGVVVSAVQLEEKMAGIGRQLADQPELHVRPHRKCAYAVFASVLSSSKRHGLSKVAVIGSEQFIP